MRIVKLSFRSRVGARSGLAVVDSRPRILSREGAKVGVERGQSVPGKYHDNLEDGKVENNKNNEGAESPEETEEKIGDTRAPLKANEVATSSEKDNIDTVNLDLRTRI